MFQVVENSVRRHTIGAFTACFTGFSGGEVALIGDAVLRVAWKGTSRIHVLPILAGHVLCDAAINRSR
jgi:hypothetical protein